MKIERPILTLRDIKIDGSEGPDKVAKILEKESPELSEDMISSYNQTISLSFSGGYYVLNWSAVSIGKYDWVGLYKSITDPDTNFIGGAWQWASKGSIYKTSQGMYSGYQARYLVWDSTSLKYVSVARTDPFPGIRVCS